VVRLGAHARNFGAHSLRGGIVGPPLQGSPCSHCVRASSGRDGHGKEEPGDHQSVERQQSHSTASTASPPPLLRPAVLVSFPIETAAIYPVLPNAVVKAFLSSLVHLQLGICSALMLGAANRVLFKIALVPMQNYVFFLAQLQNVIGWVRSSLVNCFLSCIPNIDPTLHHRYLLVYFTTLYVRVRAGKVTPEVSMLQRLKSACLIIPFGSLKCRSRRHCANIQALSQTGFVLMFCPLC